MKSFLTAIGIQQAQRFLEPSTIEDIPMITVEGANAWAAKLLGAEYPAPFPYHTSARPNRNLGDGWVIPGNGWGRVWFQRTAWLEHNPTGISARFILGRETPQTVLVPS